MVLGKSLQQLSSGQNRSCRLRTVHHQQPALNARHSNSLHVCGVVTDRDASSSAPSTSSSKSSENEWINDFYNASQRLSLEKLYRMSGKSFSESAGKDFLSQLPGPYFFVTVDNKPIQTEKASDFYANVGTAIRTLRQDIPLLFNQELDYNIYRDDVLFKDPRNAFQGIKNYKLIFWSLRFHGKIFFKHLYVDVKRIWQTEDDTIRMRWTVHGIPRVPWEAEGVFDGISYYKLDNNGKIYEHVVDNVILRDPPMLRSPFLAGLNLIPAAPQQQPCPGLWYGAAMALAMGSTSSEETSYAVRFSWVRLYFALLATMQVLGCSEEQVECASV